MRFRRTVSSSIPGYRDQNRCLEQVNEIPIGAVYFAPVQDGRVEA